MHWALSSGYTVVNEALGVYYWSLLFILCRCGSCHSAEKAGDGFEPWGWGRCANSSTSLVQTIPFLAWLLFTLLLLVPGPLTRVIYSTIESSPIISLLRNLRTVVPTWSYVNLELLHLSDFICCFSSVVATSWLHIRSYHFLACSFW